MRTLSLGLVCLCALTAVASPVINSATVTTRIYNDDSNSVLNTGNLYPSHIWIQDAVLDGDGQGGEWANRHNFRLSDNGGISPATFMNADGFAFAADVTITGTASSEGGLNLSPWWSQAVDGNFMINAGSGEVACFGGRLPFYSFTGSYGVHYVKGDTVRMGFAYDPRSLSQADPGAIKYWYIDSTGHYESPWLAFDQGNPGEDPPYGLWGILNFAQVGGYFQPYIQVGNPDNWGRIDFGNIWYVPEPASLALLGLALVLARRGR